MTINTRSLSHRTIAGFDLDRLMEIFHRECQGVKETVVRLGNPFSKWMVWQVAIVADRHMAMAGVLPRIEVVLHDVAVSARRRIVA